MPEQIFIFENSNAPHETSIVSISKVYKKIGYNIIYCLNKKAQNNLTDLGEKLDAGNLINLSSPFWPIKFLLAKTPGSWNIFNSIYPRSILTVILATFLSKNNIYYIRNANSWLYSPTHGKGIFFKLTGKFVHFFKKRMLKKAPYVITGNHNIEQYISERSGKSAITIPFHFNSDKPETKTTRQNKTFTFVIPGAVDISKKNLTTLREATRYFNKKELKQFKIILLGRPAKKSDQAFINEWKKIIGDSLVSYDKFISAELFDQTLTEANIIVSSLNINYEDKYNKEIYGRTKDTGVEAHAVAYSKPFMINKSYLPDPALKSSTIFFSDEKQCYELMKKLINNRDYYTPLVQKAISNTKKLSLEAITKEVQSKLNNIR